MNDPSLSPAARRALDVFRDQTAAPLAVARKAALWRGALAGQRAANRWSLKCFVLVAACLVGYLVVTRLFARPPPEVQASQEALWHREGGSVKLERGRLRVIPRQRLLVVTPQLEAVVENAVALFDVSSGGTLLAVESGEVEWRTPRRSGVLNAGERVTLRAQLTVALGVPSIAGCAPGPEYEGCLAGEAEGLDLAAQTALYALGMLAHERGSLARAIQLFQAYAERFPSGVFAPEASIALMVDLERGGRPEDARAEAARFLSQFPDEPRARDVAGWSEQLR